MGILKESRCAVCGNAIEQPQRGRKRKYCSRKCSNIYHNHKSAMKPMLPAGLVKCVECGKDFERTENSTRECCSRLCERAFGRRDEIEEIRLLALNAKQQERPCILRNWALELNYNGYGRKAITEALGLPRRTLKTWYEKYARESDGNWRRKRRQEAHIKKIHYSYSESQTAAEWLSALRQGVRDTKYCDNNTVLENRSIFLVCGVTDIRKNADSLSTVIQSRLKADPFEGSIFAFCGKKRNQIRYMYWDGSGFNIVLRGRETGTYPWPPPTLGKVISITSEDFEYILRGERDFSECGSRPKGWNCITVN